jgi:glycosyltransferase involved in cell wall biosynthesis
LKVALIKDERLPGEKIKVIHNGIDLNNWQTFNRWELRQKLGLERETFVILAVGRLVAWKGHSFLINALNTPPLKAEKNIKLLIAGDGPLKKQLTQLVAEQGLSAKITFLGYVTNVPELMAAADLFVLPSINEPFGLVLLEAMAAKLPIIATNDGGVPEIITHRQTGWLVPPQDATALAAAISRLKSDANLRATLAATAWQELNNRFSLAEMLAKTERVYEQCLNAK